MIKKIVLSFICLFLLILNVYAEDVNIISSADFYHTNYNVVTEDGVNKLYIDTSYSYQINLDSSIKANKITFDLKDKDHTIINSYELNNSLSTNIETYDLIVDNNYYLTNFKIYTDDEEFSSDYETRILILEKDTSAPVLNSVQFSGTAYQGEYEYLRINATDESKITSAIVKIEQPDGIVVSKELSISSNSIYSSFSMNQYGAYKLLEVYLKDDKDNEITYELDKEKYTVVSYDQYKILDYNPVNNISLTNKIIDYNDNQKLTITLDKKDYKLVRGYIYNYGYVTLTNNGDYTYSYDYDLKKLSDNIIYLSRLQVLSSNNYYKLFYGESNNNDYIDLSGATFSITKDGVTVPIIESITYDKVKLGKDDSIKITAVLYGDTTDCSYIGLSFNESTTFTTFGSTYIQLHNKGNNIFEGTFIGLIFSEKNYLIRTYIYRNNENYNYNPKLLKKTSDFFNVYKNPSSIVVDEDNSQKIFIYNKDIEAGKIKVTAYYSDGFENDVSNYVTIYDNNVLGTSTIKILYGNVSTTYEITKEEVFAKSIKIENDNLSFDVYSKEQIVAEVDDENASYTTLSYESLDSSIATVSSSGEVTGVKSGKTKIKVIAVGGFTKYVDVTINDIYISSINIYNRNLSFNYGEDFTKKIDYSYYPTNATVTELNWKSNDESIATVDKYGNVTVHKPGSTYIYVDGEFSEYFYNRVNVDVIIRLKDISFEQDEIYLDIHNTIFPDLVLNPVDTTEYIDETWYTDNPDILDVSWGRIETIGVGTANVYVYIKNLDKTISMKVNVVVPVYYVNIENQLIYASLNDTGKIKYSFNEDATYGTKVTFKSSDPSIVKIYSDGTYKCLKGGSVSIIVTTEFGYENRAFISVDDSIKNIYVNKNYFKLSLGSSDKIYASISPANTPYSKVISFVSKYPNIVQVDKNGNIKAVGVGRGEIYARSSNGLYQFITVDVYDPTPWNSALRFTTSSIKDKIYTGRSIKPSLNVYFNGHKLRKNKDYKITYGSNKNLGYGYIYIKGIKTYTDTKVIKFKILPKKVSIKSPRAYKGGKIKVSFTKQKGVSGYELAYRVKGSSYNYMNLSSGTSSQYLFGFSKKTKYQIMVRSYIIIDNNKYYGLWSSLKTITAK